jgi:hypothetical protein
MFAAMHLSSIYCVVTYCSKCYFGHLIIMIYKIHLLLIYCAYCSKCYFGHLIIMIYKIHLLLAIVTLIWFMYFIHLSYVNRSVRLCNLSTSYYVIFLLN